MYTLYVESYDGNRFFTFEYLFDAKNEALYWLSIAIRYKTATNIEIFNDDQFIWGIVV